MPIVLRIEEGATPSEDCREYEGLTNVLDYIPFNCCIGGVRLTGGGFLSGGPVIAVPARFLKDLGISANGMHSCYLVMREHAVGEGGTGLVSNFKVIPWDTVESLSARPNGTESRADLFERFRGG